MSTSLAAKIQAIFEALQALEAALNDLKDQKVSPADTHSAVCLNSPFHAAAPSRACTRSRPGRAIATA